MMEDLRNIEQQLLQYQAVNPFGSNMSKVLVSEFTPNDWDRDSVTFARGQATGSWIYICVLKLDFDNAPVIKPPYMIMHDAELNGQPIQNYKNISELVHPTNERGASSGIEVPIPGFSRELSQTKVDFFGINASGFQDPPSAKFKLWVYSFHPVRASIVFEGVPNRSNVALWN